MLAADAVHAGFSVAEPGFALVTACGNVAAPVSTALVSRSSTREMRSNERRPSGVNGMSSRASSATLA